MRVLVISRSKFFREAVRFIIQDMVDKVETTERPDSVKDVGDYDLILCDLSCFDEPRKIADILRAFKERGVRVVVFSFDPAERFRDFITRAGADGYIHRPLDPESVRDLISRIR
ncbi:MAG: hypothetical protein Q9N26_01500 [Aquificota bacterium]|nr:hypothetical protein [Aquificota bacterium]